MRSATIIVALAAVACAAAVDLGHGLAHHDSYAHPHYKYSYAVADKHTGDQKNAQEHRDGGVTHGSYSLVQPDGVVRTVKYVVTPHGGFQAQVLNNGVAAHPAGHGHHGGHGLGGHGLAGRGLGYGLGGYGGAHSAVAGLGYGLGGHGLGYGYGY